MTRYRKPLTARSSKWRSLSNEFLAGKVCACCGRKEKLVAHHILPVHEFPEHELDEQNLIPLCEGRTVNCHLAVGHLFDWRSFNADAVSDAKYINDKVRLRP